MSGSVSLIGPTALAGLMSQVSPSELVGRELPPQTSLQWCKRLILQQQRWPVMSFVTVCRLTLACYEVMDPP